MRECTCMCTCQQESLKRGEGSRRPSIRVRCIVQAGWQQPCSLAPVASALLLVLLLVLLLSRGRRRPQ